MYVIHTFNPIKILVNYFNQNIYRIMFNINIHVSPYVQNSLTFVYIKRVLLFR